MNWTRGSAIGRGSTATVSVATAHPSGRVFAVKSAELSQSEFLQREQRILSAIRCPQIIGYRGSNVTAENGKLVYNLFMEYASGGSLAYAIHEQGGCLDEPTIRSYTRTILLGLEHLHSNCVVHCDIKGSNILIADNGVKIADLGCARWIDEVSGSDSAAAATPIAGTPLFMAPEVARGQQQGFPADVWALGCTVIEMVTGKAPWGDVSDPVSALYRIGFSGDVPEIPSSLSEQAKDFLDKCLRRDPGERWSASELLQHAFFEEPNFPVKEIHASNLDTPTSVLDQSFWGSMEEEELETTHNPSHPSSSNSPAERIQRLSGGILASSLTMPSSAGDENWVTVRSNNIEELEILSCCQDHKPFYANEPTTCGTDTTWLDEDRAMLCSSEPTGPRGIVTYNTISNCGCSCSIRYKRIGLSMGSVDIDDVFCKSIALRTMKIFAFFNITSLSISYARVILFYSSQAATEPFLV